MPENIIIESHFDNLATEGRSEYVAHVYCYAGHCDLFFNGQSFVLKAGQCMVIVTNRLLESVTPSSDCVAKLIYIKMGFLGQCTPLSNFGVVGTCQLFANPIFELTPEESVNCRKNFEAFERKFFNKAHHFYDDVMVSSTQLLFLDFFEFQVRIYGEQQVPLQSALLMSRFLQMLETGIYREHREVAYYASELCVVPKYLSQVSKSVSGFSANYWIDRFTIQDIRRNLRDKTKTFQEIADMFNFSSLSYFSRYVQRILGASLTDLRN